MGPNGEIQVQYTKIAGNRHKFSFAAKDEGEAFEQLVSDQKPDRIENNNT